jgi:integrase
LLPVELDTPHLFPATRGGHIDDNKWRYRVWTPALRAAGIEHRRIYDCRHTFAWWAIAGGVHLYGRSCHRVFRLSRGRSWTDCGLDEPLTARKACSSQRCG